MVVKPTATDAVDYLKQGQLSEEDRKNDYNHRNNRDVDGDIENYENDSYEDEHEDDEYEDSDCESSPEYQCSTTV